MADIADQARCAADWPCMVQWASIYGRRSPSSIDDIPSFVLLTDAVAIGTDVGSGW